MRVCMSSMMYFVLAFPADAGEVLLRSKVMRVCASFVSSNFSSIANAVGDFVAPFGLVGIVAISGSASLIDFICLFSFFSYLYSMGIG